MVPVANPLFSLVYTVLQLTGGHPPCTCTEDDHLDDSVSGGNRHVPFLCERMCQLHDVGIRGFCFLCVDDVDIALMEDVPLAAVNLVGVKYNDQPAALRALEIRPSSRSSGQLKMML